MFLPFKHIDTSMNVILAVLSRRKAVNLPESDLLYFLVAFPWVDLGNSKVLGCL